MGNGQGIKPKTVIFDFETAGLSGVLTEEMIEDAAAKMMANFGRPSNPIIFMPPGLMFPWEANPRYSGTPWASKDRLTKREHAVAGLHTTLKKLGVLKNISTEELEEIKNKSIKRLKRAKWAQNVQKKKA